MIGEYDLTWKCDICGKPLPPYKHMEHNDATQEWYGEVFKANGVIMDPKHRYRLCEEHINEVINLIEVKRFDSSA